MIATISFPALLESFFTHRLMQQRQSEPAHHWPYRIRFAYFCGLRTRRLGRPPARLVLRTDRRPVDRRHFLTTSEKNRRHRCPQPQFATPTAIRILFPLCRLSRLRPTRPRSNEYSPYQSKRWTRATIDFLTRPEIDALLAAPDTRTWSGRRDHALLLVAVQTGLRLAELTGLRREAVILGLGAHIRVLGKGRKERSTPLTKTTAAVLKGWLRETSSHDDAIVFPSARGVRMSADGVQYLLSKHVANACTTSCPSLKSKRVTPHVLRHTTAMELLQAGVDRAVIALWLGHESLETTQIYLDANLALKEAALSKIAPTEGKAWRYRPGRPADGLPQGAVEQKTMPGPGAAK